MPLFAGASFSPFQLRPLLRAVLEPGERIIGWGPIQLRGGLWANIDHLGLALTPGLGQLLATILGRQQRRFMLITDRRLLVILASSRGPDPSLAGLTLDAPLPTIRCRRQPESDYFVLLFDPDEPEAVFEIIEPTRSAQRRLAEALDLLASPDADPVPPGATPVA